MSRGTVEIAHQQLSVPVVERRRLEERIGVRFPSVLLAVTRAWGRLPPRSRLRQALLRRMVQLGVAAANRRDFEAMFALYDPAVELTGGGGADTLRGGRGNDLLRAGGGADTLNCGAGRRDRAVAGRRDRVRRCEQVRRRGR